MVMIVVITVGRTVLVIVDLGMLGVVVWGLVRRAGQGDRTVLEDERDSTKLIIG